VVLLKSPQMGAYMNKNVSGIGVPQEWIDEIGSVDKGDRKKKAAEMMGRCIKKHKDKFQGVHIMPLGWTDIVPDILEQAEISINGYGK
jgi:5,10-methylenetetrahydrofolate reductase